MNAYILAACAALACAGAANAETARRQPVDYRDAPVPPDFSQPLASPGIHRSGNDCAPDRAEAAWSRSGKLLGYYCVRAPSNVR